MESVIQNEQERLELLQNEMEKCLNDPDISDLDVECEGSTLKCHRAILAARSTKFKQLVSREENSAKLVVEDVDLQVLQVGHFFSNIIIGGICYALQYLCLYFCYYSGCDVIHLLWKVEDTERKCCQALQSCPSLSFGKS